MQIKKISQSSGVVATVVDRFASTSTTNASSAKNATDLKSYIDIKGKKCMLYRAALQSIPATTSTEVYCDNSIYSYDSSLFSNATGRIYLGSTRIKTVSVNARVQFSSSTVNVIYLCKNGTPFASVSTPSIDTNCISGTVEATNGDYISLKVYTAGAVNVTTSGSQWNGLEVTITETND